MDLFTDNIADNGNVTSLRINDRIKKPGVSNEKPALRSITMSGTFFHIQACLQYLYACTIFIVAGLDDDAAHHDGPRLI